MAMGSISTTAKLLSLLRRSLTTSHLLQLHAHLITTSPISSQPFFFLPRLLLALCDSSTSQTHSSYADLLFSQIPHPNTFAWNTLIRFHALASNPCRSLLLFARMRRAAIAADAYTYPFVLKACAAMPTSREGVVIHGVVLKTGFVVDLFVTNALISFYCRFGEIVLARCLFDACRSRDLVSWNTMMAGYAGCGAVREAQKLFDEMPVRDAFSWAVLIDGYGKKLGDVGRARVLFDEMTDKDLVCWNCMIDGYASVGELGAARELFEVMPQRCAVSWSVLIDNYVRYGEPKEALGLFWRMLWEGTKSDKVSAVGAIAACGQLGALDDGQWVHSYLRKNKIVLDVVVQTALVDMYMKCGSVVLARRVFESMSERSLVSWNVMIVGLGNNGHGEEAVELFHLMEREGAAMDDLTLLGVLTACTHGGMLAKGLEIFDRMKMANFKIVPKVEHYGCVVDLLARAGRLDEARNVIETMPMKASSTLWGSLLAACRTHRRIDLAELSVERLAELGADDSSVYVLMSNIYAEEGMWQQVWRTRRLMTERGMKKEIGRSVVEVEGGVHEFVNGDASHPQCEEVHAMIWSLFNVISSTR